MISLFFGLPGAGKTTILCSLALKYSKSFKGNPYKNVYTNVRMSVPGVTYIDNECIGRYDLSDSLLLIDEASLFADSRDYRNFDKEKLSFFLLHRHYRCDIYLFTQQWDGIDRKIRVITDKVYYVYKGKLFGKLWSSYYRIPYGIIIPDPKKNQEKLGEIIQGYSKPPLLQRIFSTKVWRKKYYHYFDSWEAPHLDPLPADKYFPYIPPLVDPQHYLVTIDKNKKFPLSYKKISLRSDLIHTDESTDQSEENS